MNALLNKEALRALRDEKETIQLGTVSARIDKKIMDDFADLQSKLTKVGIRRYPREQIIEETYKLLIELMKEDLAKAEGKSSERK